MFTTFEEKMKNSRKVIPHKWKPQVTNQWKVVYVAYIDARAVADLLDETFGINNWKVEFFHRDRNTILKLTEKITEVDKDKKEIVKEKIVGTIPITETITVCRISIYDDEKKEWVSKEDVGSHSDFAETNKYGDKEDDNKEKSDASDAFKRAGVKLGIGSFLYDYEPIEFSSTNYKGAWKATDDMGNILWNFEDLEYAIQQKQLGNPKIDIKNKISSNKENENTEPTKTEAHKQQQEPVKSSYQSSTVKTTVLKDALVTFKNTLIGCPLIDVRLREILSDEKNDEPRIEFIKTFFGVNAVKDVSASMLSSITERVIAKDVKMIETINSIVNELAKK